MSERPEPITAEELAKLRESVRMLGGHDNYALHWSNHTVARLIATLDEVRIGTAESVDFGEGAPDAEPDTELHAEHFDPACEECAYLARPTRETLAPKCRCTGLQAAHNRRCPYYRRPPRGADRRAPDSGAEERLRNRLHQKAELLQRDDGGPTTFDQTVRLAEVHRIIDEAILAPDGWGEHKPGEAHYYGPMVCEVCGVRGQVNISIVPERAAEHPDCQPRHTWADADKATSVCTKCGAIRKEWMP